MRPDPVAVQRFLDWHRHALASGRGDAPALPGLGVTVDRSRVSIRADGHALGEAYVVRLGQPYRAHAKDLLEVQNFPRLPKYPGGPVERHDVFLPRGRGVALEEGNGAS